MGETYYDILGVTKDATPEEVRQAYFDLARKFHPDTNPNPAAREVFFNIQEAFEILSDVKRRKEYEQNLPTKEYAAPLISMHMKYSRSEIPRLDESQLMYMLLDLNCISQLDQIQTPQAHLCIVLDKSTSMKGSRIEMVKANLNRLIKKLKPHDLISIITFNDRAEIILAPTRISDFNQIENKISRIHVGGGTEIYKGLKAGMDLLWHGSAQSFSRYIVLMTDGHTYGDEEKAYDLARKAAEQGIIISALGIGHEWNDDFLDKLANITGGGSMFVANPEDLNNYLNQLTESLSMVYAKNLTLEFVSNPKVELQYLFRIQPDISDLPIEKPIRLGDLFQKKKSSYLFAFKIQPLDSTDDELKLVKGRIRMEVSAGDIESARLILNLTIRVKDDLEKERPPTEIVQALSKITLYQMQEKTKRDVKEGEISGAVKRLGYMATRLLAQGNKPFANTVLLEAERLRKDHSFSADGDKRIKYGTRALLLLPEPKMREP